MSEGKKMEMINISEEEMQKKINEAEGKAEEILTISRPPLNRLLRLGPPSFAKVERRPLSFSFLRTICLS